MLHIVFGNVSINGETAAATTAIKNLTTK